MTTDRQLDDKISRWLEAEAPIQLPDRVLGATFERTRTTRQQGGWRTLLGRTHMNRSVLALGGGAVVVAAIGLALGLYVNNPSSGVGGPGSPSPSPAPTRQASVAQPSSEPSAATQPTSMPGGGLPAGPFSFVPANPFSYSGRTVTVSLAASGWALNREWTFLFKGDGEDEWDESILFWAFPGQEFYVPADACRVTSTRPDSPASTVDEFAAAVAAQASRDASEPEDVTVGGYKGKLITLRVPEDVVPQECEEGSFVGYVTSPSDFWFTAAADPGTIEERWILDVDGTILIINALYNPDTPAALVDEMRAIVESTTFETP